MAFGQHPKDKDGGLPPKGKLVLRHSTVRLNQVARLRVPSTTLNSKFQARRGSWHGTLLSGTSPHVCRFSTVFLQTWFHQPCGWLLRRSVKMTVRGLDTLAAFLLTTPPAVNVLVTARRCASSSSLASGLSASCDLPCTQCLGQRRGRHQSWLSPDETPPLPNSGHVKPARGLSSLTSWLPGPSLAGSPKRLPSGL